MSLPYLLDISGGHKTAIVSGDRKKYHTTWTEGPNKGAEMVEEYDLKTDDLVVRKLRRPTELGLNLT